MVILCKFKSGPQTILQLSAVCLKASSVYDSVMYKLYSWVIKKEYEDDNYSLGIVRKLVGFLMLLLFRTKLLLIEFLVLEITELVLQIHFASCYFLFCIYICRIEAFSFMWLYPLLKSCSKIS